MAGRKPRITYMDLDRPVSTLGGVHPLLRPGVNRVHVCLHFIYCGAHCSHQRERRAFPDCIIVRATAGEHRGGLIENSASGNLTSGVSPASREGNVWANERPPRGGEISGNVWKHTSAHKFKKKKKTYWERS